MGLPSVGGSRGGKRNLPNPAPLDLPVVGTPTFGGPITDGPAALRVGTEATSMSGQHGSYGHEHHHGHSEHQHGHGGHPAIAAANLVTDPVCGMRVDPATSKHRIEHAGTTFHFCSAGCRTKFEADPGSISQPKADAPTQPPRKGTIYTCPMHPRDPAGWARQLPDLRHGAGAAGGHRRGGPQPRARRHDPAVLDRACPDLAGLHPGNGRPYPGARPAPPRAAANLDLGCSSCWRRRWCSGPGGRSSSAAGSRW